MEFGGGQLDHHLEFLESPADFMFRMVNIIDCIQRSIALVIAPSHHPRGNLCLRTTPSTELLTASATSRICLLRRRRRVLAMNLPGLPRIARLSALPPRWPLPICLLPPF